MDRYVKVCIQNDTRTCYALTLLITINIIIVLLLIFINCIIGREEWTCRRGIYRHQIDSFY
jgi:hypothetical protein